MPLNQRNVLRDLSNISRFTCLCAAVRSTSVRFSDSCSHSLLLSHTLTCPWQGLIETMALENEIQGITLLDCFVIADEIQHACLELVKQLALRYGLYTLVCVCTRCRAYQQCVRACVAESHNTPLLSLISFCVEQALMSANPTMTGSRSSSVVIPSRWEPSKDQKRIRKKARVEKALEKCRLCKSLSTILFKNRTNPSKLSY